MSVRGLAARVLRKPWTAEEIDRYIGARLDTYLGYATDDEVRELAASGGVVSALLCALLAEGRIDGALVCRTVVEDGRVRARYAIATDRDEVLEARGSKYVAAPFAAEAVPLIESFPGRLAVVGLPCDITLIGKLARSRPEIDERVALTVALLCGHNSEPALIDEVTRRLQAEAGSRLTDYRFRVGHWRGRLRATFDDGTVIEKPSSYFNLYQNLYFFSDKKCMYCRDHFGYDADVSVGDVWEMSLAEDPIKRSGLIVKTRRGAEAVESARGAGALALERVGVDLILDGQARTAPFHNNLTARAKAGRLFGMRITDKSPQPVRWHEYLAAVIALANWRLTRSARGARLVFATPRPLLKAYLYVLKGLESLR